MKKKRYYTGLIATTIVTCGVYGQSTINTDSLKMLEGDHLQEVQVMAHGHQHAKTRGLANTDLIGSGDLLRAACWPAVDRSSSITISTRKRHGTMV